MSEMLSRGEILLLCSNLIEECQVFGMQIYRYLTILLKDILGLTWIRASVIQFDRLVVPAVNQ